MKTLLIMLLITSTAYMVNSTELETGELQGQIKFDEEQFVSTIFDIVLNDDDISYKITMHHAERPYSFNDLIIEGNEMVFDLDTGNQYQCKLSLDDTFKNDIDDCAGKDGYCGECSFNIEDKKDKLIVISIPVMQTEEPMPDQIQTTDDNNSLDTTQVIDDPQKIDLNQATDITQTAIETEAADETKSLADTKELGKTLETEQTKTTDGTKKQDNSESSKL